VAETNAMASTTAPPIASKTAHPMASTTATTAALETTPTTTKRQTSAAKKKSNKKGDTWINSKAKELLRNNIIAGKVTNKSQPETVQEYTKWPYKNFKTNLKNLLQAVTLDYRRMAEDCDAYGDDIALLLEPKDKI
jgi:hypothetical protein